MATTKATETNYRHLQGRYRELRKKEASEQKVFSVALLGTLIRKQFFSFGKKSFQNVHQPIKSTTETGQILPNHADYMWCMLYHG